MSNTNLSNNVPFISHLESLRWHLIRSVCAVFFGTIIAFLNKKFIFDSIIFACKENDFPTYVFLCNVSESLCIKDMPFILMNVEMSGQFMTHIMVSVVAGIIIVFPYLVFEMWKFIAPALYLHEKRYSVLFFISTTFLFILGVLFGYYIIIPFSINFLSTYNVSSSIENNIHFISFIKTVSTLILSTGFLFQLPIVIFFLTKFNLITSNQLKQYRKHAFVIILLLASILTPPDIFSQVLIALPIFVLYELSIFISYLNKPRT